LFAVDPERILCGTRGLIDPKATLPMILRIFMAAVITLSLTLAGGNTAAAAGKQGSSWKKSHKTGGVKSKKSKG
jgi:hypothetical protein